MMHVNMALKCVGVILLLTFVSDTLAKNVREEFADNSEEEELTTPVKDDEEELPGPVKDEEVEENPLNDNEQNEEEEPQTALLDIDELAGTEKEIKGDGLNAQGGDIALTNEQLKNEKWDNANVANVANGFIKEVTKHWPKVNGRVKVPFTIDRSVAEDPVRYNLILRSIAKYKKVSCVDWIYYVSTTPRQHYVRIFNGNGCWSMIGMTKYSNQNFQYLSLGYRCNYFAVVQHEMLHALGFFHEQSRPDRDQYVKVRRYNVQSNRRYNFDVQTAATLDTSGIPYDVGSIMQYPSSAFVTPGRFRKGRPNTWSMERRDGVDGGLIRLNKDTFTAIDIKELNHMYKCKAKKSTPKGTPKRTPKPTPKPIETCEGLAKLGLCGYKEISNLCKKQCRSAGSSKPLANLRDIKFYMKYCGRYKEEGRCNPSHNKHGEMMEHCLKTCFPFIYPKDRACEGLAKLGLCGYKEICNLCKEQCRSSGSNKPLAKLRDKLFYVKTCQKYAKQGKCKPNQVYHKKMMEVCLKTCFPLVCPKDGACEE